MQMKDESLNRILHTLSRIVNELDKLGLKNIALKIEEVREDLLFAIEQDQEEQ